MGIFDGFTTADPAATTLDPKRLFRALPKPLGSEFKFPHDIQTEVWNQWFNNRDERDLVLKLNTGSGKTVIGLVIARSSLNEGKGPAAYLVPNTQLQEQVAETANALGIRWTDDPRDPAFHHGEAVLVCTAQTIYNGRSKFGLEGGVRRIDVGTIIIDDAHACIPAIEAQFSLLLPSSTSAYQKLRARFADALKQQSLSGWTDINSGGASHAVPVPYWAWSKDLESSYAILDKVTEKESSEHQFRWPLIREHLALCDVAFTGTEVEIRLPYPDLSVSPSYVGARRRIYMTATLADDGVLVTKMGVDEKCVLNPITPGSASDIGDRIILTPVETSRAVTVSDVRESAARLAQTHNVVVIAPSTFKANGWKQYTNEIHSKDTVKDAVRRLKEGHVGLVVLVARYDGVDLPGDACRVLVIDGLPERYSPMERVEAAAIGDTPEMSVQQVQRIEQGMGRGVRATDDYCAVILLDARLVGRLYAAADRDMLSPGTRAQYELSTQFSAGGRGASMQFFDEAIEAFLARDKGWTDASRHAVEGLTYEKPEKLDALLSAERDAFAHVRAGRKAKAVEVLRARFADIKEPRFRAWTKQRAAAYLDLEDPVGARTLQENARLDSPYILKVPGATAPRLTALGDQADASAGYLARTFTSPRQLEVAVDAMLLDLTPSTATNSHKRFEAALEQLGSMLGFTSGRPDAETGIGPDNLWAIGKGRYWVIECKSEAQASEVSREYLEQVSHSADWFEDKYPGFEQLPIIIHPSRTPMWDAVPRKTARVMTFARLESLRTAVRGFASAVCLDNAYRDAERVKANLEHFGLAASEIEQRWTQSFTTPGSR
ncbi:helicase C-terminal domain-containing protein [Microbacterium nymphoidis]|uniref:helicase C-terminal domain-containing protein n=1 Tax=Microbacterium nymphoidis TaxID=2898586 RepID=UPI001E64D4BC|nr:helicase C-terminal domain-containing protein [Microbacterium nymphoidis]MCD2498496.1 DEAD/DEAH box helicase family protein [Microbacterium nymphoidis]